MITIGIPVNMETTIEHLKRAGWPVAFSPEQGVEFVSIGERQGRIARWRSQEIPLEVGGLADVGIVGSDWVKERELEFPGLEIKVLAEFDSYGRHFGTRPRLELITSVNNPIKATHEIPKGSVIRTEHLYLTREFFKKMGFDVAIMERTSSVFNSPPEFDQWCKENGIIGLRRIAGQPESFASLEQVGYSTVVTETGTSLMINPVKSIETIENIKILLITTINTVNDPERRIEIDRLTKDLNKAYFLINGEFEGTQGLERKRI